MTYYTLKMPTFMGTYWERAAALPAPTRLQPDLSLPRDRYGGIVCAARVLALSQCTARYLNYQMVR